MRLIDADKLEELFREVIGRIAKRQDINFNMEHMIRASAMVIEMIKDAPTVTPEPHWIPVTERLPENNDPVNVTWVNHNPEVYYMDIKDKPYTATAIYFRGKWFWYSCVIEDWLSEYGSNESLLANLQEAVDRDIEITAWCELPEPYKGVTE